MIKRFRRASGLKREDSYWASRDSFYRDYIPLFMDENSSLTDPLSSSSTSVSSGFNIERSSFNSSLIGTVFASLALSVSMTEGHDAMLDAMLVEEKLQDVTIEQAVSPIRLKAYRWDKGNVHLKPAALYGGAKRVTPSILQINKLSWWVIRRYLKDTTERVDFQGPYTTKWEWIDEDRPTYSVLRDIWDKHGLDGKFREF